MLDFYAVHDLHPFPDDLPAEHISLGGMDIAEYHECAEIVHSCLAKIGVEASYFSDWTVSPDQHGEVLRCLESSRQDLTDEARRALDAFSAIVRRAEGFTLLAVCD